MPGKALPGEVFPRRGGPCTHRSCQGDPTGCRSYAEEVLTVTPSDEFFGQMLVRDGWWSTSRKHCHIACWIEPVPQQETIEHVLVALAGEFHGKRLANSLKWSRLGGINAPEHLLERRTITPSQMTAFKRAGGDCARCS